MDMVVTGQYFHCVCVCVVASRPNEIHFVLFASDSSFAIIYLTVVYLDYSLADFYNYILYQLYSLICGQKLENGMRYNSLGMVKM